MLVVREAENNFHKFQLYCYLRILQKNWIFVEGHFFIKLIY